MGQLSQHPGHKAQARERIEKAREHYQTRAERRVNKATKGPKVSKKPISALAFAMMAADTMPDWML